MRLGQLSRQLEIKPEKIISYLEKEKKITIKQHPNSKVEDELVSIITTHFKPDNQEVENNKESEIILDKELKKEETPISQKEPEHIETVKIEVAQELKIIGKIDLPDKSQIKVEVDGVIYDQETLDIKKKEEQIANRERRNIEKEEKRKEADERKQKAREQREIEEERLATLETEKHNILSKEAEKKKAIIIKAQQEREQKLEEKRKKKQKSHYSQQISSKPKSTPKKKKKTVTKEIPDLAIVTNDNKVEISTEEQVKDIREKSVYKRFIKWLNT